MSTTQQTARTTEEGGAVDLKSPLWPDTGVEPAELDAYVYAPYEEPVAGLDNGINYKITYDHGQLNYRLGKFEDRLNVLENQLDSLREDLTDLENQFSNHNHDSRYYRKTEADDRFVDETGDTMTGPLELTNDPSTNAPRLILDSEISQLTHTVQDSNGRASIYWNVESGTQNIITENEGASWFFMDGGRFQMDVYDGESGDAGAPPNWTRILDADTSGVTFDEGITLGNPLEMDQNNITGTNTHYYSTYTNDFIRLEDGSNGSNETAYTLRFDDRNLQFYSGTGSGRLAELGQFGNFWLREGDLLLEQSSSRISIGGEHGGPHEIDFGDPDSDGITVTYHTTPQVLDIETGSGETIARFDRNQTVDFSNSYYVVLPVRGGPPSDPPSGATWIET